MRHAAGPAPPPASGESAVDRFGAVPILGREASGGGGAETGNQAGAALTGQGGHPAGRRHRASAVQQLLLWRALHRYHVAAVVQRLRAWRADLLADWTETEPKEEPSLQPVQLPDRHMLGVPVELKMGGDMPVRDTCLVWSVPPVELMLQCLG